MKPGPSNSYDHQHGHVPHAHSGSAAAVSGGGGGGRQYGGDQMNTPQLSLSDYIADKTTDLAQIFGAGGPPNEQNPAFAPFFNFSNMPRKQDYPNKGGVPGDRTLTWDQFSRKLVNFFFSDLIL